ncbi:hypothetical protein RJ641_033439 [Dillenia turbinata]|uniref:Uncharacterized protein n=1 Tax=Dillenia turbinata TaxID=194707 RepID=A0AAN8VR79_9MAGN
MVKLLSKGAGEVVMIGNWEENDGVSGGDFCRVEGVVNEKRRIGRDGRSDGRDFWETLIETGFTDDQINQLFFALTLYLTLSQIFRKPNL